MIKHQFATVNYVSISVFHGYNVCNFYSHKTRRSQKRNKVVSNNQSSSQIVKKEQILVVLAWVQQSCYY